MSSVSWHPEEFYTPFFSDSAKERRPSPIRGLFPLEKRPGVISLLAGKPNPDTFPLTSVTFTARSLYDLEKEDSYTISDSALSQALQYSDTSGLPQLLNWLTGLQEKSHGRKVGEGWRVSVGSGSQDVLYKVKPLIHYPEIEVDAQGISSGSLRKIMDEWPINKPKPRVLYTVPYGCNPTGITTAIERRREVLEIARAHNILILEDDPYFYLYFGDQERPPSFFALEAQMGGTVGNVVRFDSFSKVLSAGIRIGFVSGPEPILRAIDMHTATANLQVSSLTQAIVFSLLSDWGYDGFGKHIEHVSQFYRSKRDVFQSAMKRHLDGLAEWEVPVAGMFFWFKLRLPAHAGAPEGDSKELIETKAYENGVLALPGTVFIPNDTKTAYVRASFSLLDEEQVNEALRRLGEHDTGALMAVFDLIAFT
ncbi:hypothetical protein Clacol_001956 [Clathrus columnatus]|uniref:Aminotransferase class I/classII large domain-containing protein n=1 Tax=Clathrus columnatus TaxID=1419009 RepID=A0AAV5A3Z6_9AGAM|nr:hypothetical protein Clacol_001956 [Clathrus columnatus]